MGTRLRTLATMLLIATILQFSSSLPHSTEQVSTSTLSTRTESSVTQTASVATPCLTPTSADISSVQIQPASVNSTISGHVVSPIAKKEAHIKGQLPRNSMLQMEIVFALRNADNFHSCLASINNPRSANYGQHLNLAALQPYLPTPGDKSSIVSYLAQRGFTVTGGASPLVLRISANVRTVEATFAVNINQYSVGNFSFYGVDTDPSLPQNFASMVDGVIGLTNYTAIAPAESPCSGPYCPQGIQVGYSLTSLYSSGDNGAGQNVAIVDTPGDPSMQTAIDTFDSQYSLVPTTLDIRYPDGVPSSYNPAWASETAMDVEAVHSVAPGAGIVLLYDAVDLMNAVDYVATNNLATIVSNSWTYICTSPPRSCSDTQLPASLVSTVDSRLALDVAQGLTILFASGDQGAKPDGTNFGTEFPASDPNVLAVGATNLVLSGCTSTTCAGYSSESGASISGGGYSGHFSEPSWQTSSIGPKAGRAVPDVSMLGGTNPGPGIWVYSSAVKACAGGSIDGGGWFGCSGTSLSTPLWAGFLAVALQIRGGGSFGNIGPLLYQIASGSGYTTDFHDVTTGSNNGYSAGSGWDPVTGWGSPIASSLAASLSQAQLSVTFNTIPTSFLGTSSPGNITACGGTFTNGQSSSCPSSFNPTANLPSPAEGWQFDHWTWTGGVNCLSNTANPASCTFASLGSLTAVFRAQVTFMVNLSSAVIGWGSCAGPSEGNGATVYDMNYGSVTACYVPSGFTVSSWSCTGGLSCSGSNDLTSVTFTGPGTITLNLKTGSLSNPFSTSLTASATPSSPTHGTSFTVSGTLTTSSGGLGGKAIVLVFGWSTNIATVMTAGDGSYTYTATAPTSPGSYDVDAFFLGDYGAGAQYLPSMATANINAS